MTGFRSTIRWTFVEKYSPASNRIVCLLLFHDAFGADAKLLASASLVAGSMLTLDKYIFKVDVSEIQ